MESLNTIHALRSDTMSDVTQADTKTKTKNETVEVAYNFNYNYNYNYDTPDDEDDTFETIAVPTTFGQSDVVTCFGVSEFPITVDRISIYDERVYAESFSGDEFIEVGFFPKPEHPALGGHEQGGWIATHLKAVDPADFREGRRTGVGTTVWLREREQE